MTFGGGVAAVPSADENMAEEDLQHLLEQIHREAVEKAQQEAERIVSAAKQKAASIVKEAETEAQGIVEKAQRDAEAFTQRSIRTLEQAARDLLITVGKGVENILSDLVAEAVDEALTIDVVKQMLIKIAEACAQREGESRIEILVSPDDEKELVKFFAERYRQKMLRGIELHVDKEIFKGFKVSFVEDYVYHDFTREAIADALSKFLRPHLAEIVSRVAREKQEQIAGEGPHASGGSGETDTSGKAPAAGGQPESPAGSGSGGEKE